jgi:uncharacterized membrane protein
MSKKKSRKNQAMTGPSATGRPVQQPGRPVAVFQQQTTITATQFLPGEELAKIEAVIPGGADRVLRIIENQSAHRIKQEDRVVSGNGWKEWFGQITAAIVVIGGMYGGYRLAMAGKDVAGYVSALGPLAIVAGVFLVGRKRRDRELQGKDVTR